MERKIITISFTPESPSRMAGLTNRERAIVDYRRVAQEHSKEVDLVDPEEIPEISYLHPPKTKPDIIFVYGEFNQDLANKVKRRASGQMVKEST